MMRVARGVGMDKGRWSCPWVNRRFCLVVPKFLRENPIASFLKILINFWKGWCLIFIYFFTEI